MCICPKNFLYSLQRRRADSRIGHAGSSRFHVSRQLSREAGIGFRGYHEVVPAERLVQLADVGSGVF